MLRHPSAIKRNRQNKKRRARNVDAHSTMKTAVKSTLQVVLEGNKEKALESFQKTSSIIAKTISKGIVHKNTGSRKISRLAKKVAAVGSAS